MSIDPNNVFLLNLGRYCADATSETIGSFPESEENGDRFRLSMWDAVERSATTWEIARRECQSPIEEILLAHVIFASFGYGDGDGIVVWDPTKDYSATEETTGVFFGLQREVGPYRADFLFTCHAGGHSRRVVVECDGHDYHERSKEQAQRDKARDRFMVTDGITVLRFTGSEIYRNAAGCREQIERVLANSFESAAISAGLMSGRRDRS